MDLVPFLIERKAQVNIQNNDGSTALIVAAFFCHPDIVTLLLEAGAETWSDRHFLYQRE